MEVIYKSESDKLCNSANIELIGLEEISELRIVVSPLGIETSINSWLINVSGVEGNSFVVIIRRSWFLPKDNNSLNFALEWILIYSKPWKTILK
jgi:hypothetical protein